MRTMTLCLAGKSACDTSVKVTNLATYSIWMSLDYFLNLVDGQDLVDYCVKDEDCAGGKKAKNHITVALCAKQEDSSVHGQC